MKKKDCDNCVHSAGIGDFNDPEWFCKEFDERIHRDFIEEMARDCDDFVFPEEAMIGCVYCPLIKLSFCNECRDFARKKRTLKYLARFQEFLAHVYKAILWWNVDCKKCGKGLEHDDEVDFWKWEFTYADSKSHIFYSEHMKPTNLCWSCIREQFWVLTLRSMWRNKID